MFSENRNKIHNNHDDEVKTAIFKAKAVKMEDRQWDCI